METANPCLRYIVENLNLEGLPARGATVTVAPTALRGAPEAQKGRGAKGCT